MRAILGLFLLAASIVATPSLSAAQVQARIEVSDPVAELLHAVDRLDWTRIRDLLADEVRVDYTSLFGGSVAALPADQLIRNWQGLLPGFDATQHLLGPIVVRPGADESRAEARTHVRGYHFAKDAQGGEVWMVAGHYIMQLERRAERWRISAITLVTFYQQGNLALPAFAQGRKAR
jgi:hypothetical protein